MRSTLRELLEEVTLADVAAGELPEHVAQLDGRPARLGEALAPRAARPAPGACQTTGGP